MFHGSAHQSLGCSFLVFFFNPPPTTEIYTLSLHDALPISTRLEMSFFREIAGWGDLQETVRKYLVRSCKRSEEHTSELQSRPHLVCRLLLEKKKTEPDDPAWW